MKSTSLSGRCGASGAKVVGAVLAALAVASLGNVARAAISYSTMGSLYEEKFDSFPVTPPNNLPLNGNIQSGSPFTAGWQNDVDPDVSPEADISVPGWYLYHQASIAGEGGLDTHSRVRAGSGGSNVGSFYLFASNPMSHLNAEKSLGSLASGTLISDASNGNVYMGLRLTNDTGQTLNSFTITYDGELWRRGNAATPETLFFEYSTAATPGTWQTSTAGLYAAGTAANFIAPVGLAGTTDGPIDGNTAGLVSDITGTFTGFDWYPGQDLWLRWRDPQIPGTNDDGLGIDNVRFTADNSGTGNPNNFTSIAGGSASSGSTWNDSGNPPASGKNYRILSPHAVTLDQDFAGDSITVASGGSLDITANSLDTFTGLEIRRLVIESGATLTESVSGNFKLGKLVDYDTPLGTLILQDDVDFTVGAGETFTIGMAVQGTGDMNIDTGAGSVVQLASSQGHQGVIRFNGEGDVFMLGWNKDFRRVEMNSTGDNRFSLMHTGERGSANQGDLTFNQGGTIAHETTTISTQSRLAVLGTLIANAGVTVLLTDPYPIGGPNSERRLQFLNGLQGSSDVNVIGMGSDPTNVDAGVLLHAFEVGPQNDNNADVVPSDAFSGTLTAVNFVSLKLRRNMPSARILLDANSRMDTGHGNTGASSTTFAFGEIVVNSDATLEVGFYNEKSGGSGGTGHRVGQIQLVTDGGRSGDLTLNFGSKTVMQVNGLLDGQFDTIVAEGDIILGGTLELWVNPVSTNATANPTFTPQLGDEWVIMTLAGGSSLPTDFDDSTAVDGVDLTIWKDAFGVNADGDADGDGDSDGADFLAWQRTVGQTSTPSGTITGNFIDVVSPTESGSEWAAGLDFETVVVGNEVILRVISVPAIAPVPEPSTVALVGMAALGLLAVRRKRANT